MKKEKKRTNAYLLRGFIFNLFSYSSPSEYLRSYLSFGADLGVYLYQRIYKWFGIQIGAEYSALTLIYGNTAKFDAEPYANGSYYVSINEIEVEKGYLFLHNTFIGLQFSYGFTMKKLLCRSDKM